MSEREGRVVRARVPGDGRTIRARYDAAQTTDDNRKHWGMSDGLSAKAANNVAVRRLLRTRSQYENDNNSTLSGITETLANDTVGTGPRLQMLTADGELNSFIEQAVSEHADEIDLFEKLGLLRLSGCVRGESFAIYCTNPMLESPVKLDVEIEEGDQFSDPTWQSETSPQWSDGIFYDSYGNPQSYRRLRWHPGDLMWGANPLEYDDLPARAVYHYFKKSRPGQRRGIPEMCPALSNWPELRRYCNAVIAAAETVAELSIMIETQAPTDDPDDVAALDNVELPKRGGFTLPAGYKANQMRAEQPTTTYNSFTDKKIAEGARCINMPFTIAALDSSNANLSARYLDTAIYAKVIKKARKKLEKFLNRLLDLWLTEALRIDGFLPDAAQALTRFPRKWYWPKVGEHADPDKVASGQTQRLKNGTSSIEDECAEEGQDWKEVQVKAARSLGVTVEEYLALVRFSLFGADKIPAGGAGAGGQVQEGPTPLNGAQITAAIDVLGKLREQTLPPEAAKELLKKIGFEEASANLIVDKTPQGLDNSKGDAEFKRTVLELLLAVPQAREAVYNATDIIDLITKTGLKPEKGYTPPWAALVAPAGLGLTSGVTIEDPQKDTVGANVLQTKVAGSTPNGESANQSEQLPPPEDMPAPQSTDEKKGVIKKITAWLGLS